MDLASSGTFISKTNFDVIKRAYTELLSNAASFRESYKNLLDPPIAVAMRRAGNILSDKKADVISDKPITGRRETLVSALKEKGPLGVGDLTRLLLEAGSVLSGKTVQRELGALVASGTVKQEGDGSNRFSFSLKSDGRNSDPMRFKKVCLALQFETA